MAKPSERRAKKLNLNVWTCDICSFKNPTRNGLVNHVKATHGNIRGKVCDKFCCSMVYPDKFKKHEERDHRNKKLTSVATYWWLMRSKLMTKRKNLKNRCKIKKIDEMKTSFQTSTKDPQNKRIILCDDK